ncbi:hypothetical protein BDK92_7219 [Micromonospora pisi]|uniref:Uncharacterized protein n=1 Tax=Micromonospora pisi TaxID=589240 RepID=A0A495JV85_9ACTN|nr:hypothetical protein [Micromonospora pisi]RKR92741.1 hypothetical protein BDK92_7219 [Micromonospora pisi]
MTNSSRRKYFNDGQEPESGPLPEPETPPTPKPAPSPPPVVEPPADVVSLIAATMVMGRSGTPHAQALISRNRSRRWRRIG